MKEYEEKAVSLALNCPKLQDLTNRAKVVRMSCPLFDRARWLRSNSADAWSNIANAYMRKGRLNEASPVLPLGSSIKSTFG